MAKPRGILDMDVNECSVGVRCKLSKDDCQTIPNLQSQMDQQWFFKQLCWLVFLFIVVAFVVLLMMLLSLLLQSLLFPNRQFTKLEHGG